MVFFLKINKKKKRGSSTTASIIPNGEQKGSAKQTALHLKY